MTTPRAILSTLVLAACLSACASPRKAAPSGEAAAPATLKVIDAHVHTKFMGGLERTSGIPMTEEQFRKEMRENNVVGAVALTGQHLENYHDLKDMNVIQCAGVGYDVQPGPIEAGLKSGKFSCIKIYLGYVYRYATDPAYEVIYKLAEKYKVPVVFHTGDTYDVDGLLKFSEPMPIDEVAVKHRKINLVIAHIGNPWIETAAEIAYKNANVYLDGSALLIGDLSKEDPAKIEEYVTKPLTWVFGYLEDPTKLMYGTDWPLTKMGPYLEAFKKAIPPQHWQAVFHDNAVRVFKLRDH